MVSGSPISCMINTTIWATESKENPQSVIIARQAMKDLGITPIEAPFRGGTDGSKITYKGIPTPNLFTGGEISTVNMNLSLLKRWQRRGT